MNLNPDNLPIIRRARPHPVLRSLLSWALLVAGAAGVPALAQAHHAEFMQHRPILQGLSMPVHGLDHLLVTVAVGLCAAQVGGAALWAVPALFSLCVLLGGTLNLAGVSVPLLEHGIFASVVVLGGVLAGGVRGPALLTGGLVALAALWHGNALLVPDRFVDNFFLFSVGCLLSAGALLAVGVGLGLALRRWSAPGRFPALRFAGWVVLAGAAVIGFFPAANDVVLRLFETPGH